MKSVTATGTTILTIITLFFAPVFVGHGHHRHRVEKLVKETKVHKVVKCEAHKVCPKTKTKTVKVHLKRAPKKPVKGHHKRTSTR